MIRRTSPPRSRRLLGLLVTGTALAAGAAAVPGALPWAGASAAPGSGITLVAPAKQTVWTEGSWIYGDFGIRLETGDQPLEITTVRPDYDSELETTVSIGGAETTLPAGTTSSLGQLDKFVRLKFTSADGSRTIGRTPSACVVASERTAPQGPATSPYPKLCSEYSFNPYGLGSIQGMPANWSGSLFGEYGELNMRIKPGKYDLEVTIGKPYADALGLSDTERKVTSKVVVKRFDAGRRPTHKKAAPQLQPNAKRPSGTGIKSADDLPPGTPTPDLRSLPAWGIQYDGKFLNFSATVWNGGNSPMVVDGFHRANEDVMDAYQYFFDTDGNQVDYRQVGTMEWDPDPTHLHWHFTDFATYELLNADKTKVLRSGKEAFCLANTDAVDLTGEGAAWDIEEEDLGSVCGDSPDTRSVRESLAAGWGDTYAQFRAGQAFNVKKLPDGIYYIRVMANPENNLIETRTDNNESLRKVRLRTLQSGKRALKVWPVGIIDEGSGEY